ncbi:proto-oncogene tyrosine-protein kinase Src-like [Mytilus edulis]|uniref:proto-oncogene tyrosine-protein kinase Src-like n=1 Tax=Mytilus edulis TaxID=6550 RepID=UPI0039F0DAA7
MDQTCKLCQSCLRINKNIDAISFCPSCDEFLCPSCTAAHRLNKITLTHAYNLVVPQLCESCKRGNLHNSTAAWCTECSEPLCVACADAHKRNKFTLQHEVILSSTGYEVCWNKAQSPDCNEKFPQRSSWYKEMVHECTDVKNKIHELVELTEHNNLNLKVQENEVVDAIAEVRQEIECTVLKLESDLKGTLSSEIDKCKGSYDTQKRELLDIQKSLDEFLQHLASVENYDFANNKFGLRGNMIKELSTIKKRFETTNAKMQKFYIKLANTKIIRIQKLGSITVKTEDNVLMHNEGEEQDHKQNAERIKEKNIPKERIKSHCLDPKSALTEPKTKTSTGWFPDIKRSSLDRFEKTVYSGRVWKATFQGSTIAVKKNVDNNPLSFLKEAHILKGTSHENVIKMIGVSTEHHPVSLVMEYLTEYTLKQILLDDHTSMDTSMKNMTEMTSKIAKGMDFLGTREIIHSDLRADNILFGSNWTPKVCGFKFAHMTNDHTIDPKRRRTIPPVRWLAQEIIEGEKATTKSDVWSFGILLMEVFGHCQIPYEDLKDPEVFNRIKRDLRHIRPDCCPEAIYDHAIDCWSKDPDSRITFEYISHFFGDYEICTEHGYDEVDDLEDDDYMNQ